MELNYKQITRDKKINFINNTNFIGYWNGKYKDDNKTYKGTYHDIKHKTKINATFKWNDGYTSGDFSNIKNIDQLNNEYKLITLKHIKNKYSLIDEYDTISFTNILWTYDIEIRDFLSFISDNTDIRKIIIKNTDPELNFFYYGIRKDKTDRVFFIMKPGFYYKYNENKKGYIIDKTKERFELLDSKLIKKLNKYKDMIYKEYEYSLYLEDDIYYDDILNILVADLTQDVKTQLTDGIQSNYPQLKNKIVYI
jgi:hypothetical protein